MSEERKSDWFQTYTGQVFYPFDPQPADIDIRDIAHALSLICRFNGHCEAFYSVADHCLEVHHNYINQVSLDAHMLSAGALTTLKGPKARMCALLHDAAEAYAGDTIRPIKKSMPSIEELEKPIQDAVLEKFGLTEIWPWVQPRVKEADLVILMTEKRDVVVPGPGTRREWALDKEIRPAKGKILPHDTPKEAEEAFLKLFWMLTQRIEDEA